MKIICAIRHFYTRLRACSVLHRASCEYTMMSKPTHNNSLILRDNLTFSDLISISFIKTNKIDYPCSCESNGGWGRCERRRYRLRRVGLREMADHLLILLDTVFFAAPVSTQQDTTDEIIPLGSTNQFTLLSYYRSLSTGPAVSSQLYTAGQSRAGWRLANSDVAVNKITRDVC